MDLQFFITTTPCAIRKHPVHFWMIWVESLNIHPLVAFVPIKMICNSTCNSSLLTLGEKKNYRPKLLLLSPTYRKGKGTISELQLGETAISPLLLATDTDLAWTISIFSRDTQTARDWIHISTVGVAGNYQDHASSEEYYPNGIDFTYFSWFNTYS